MSDAPLPNPPERPHNRLVALHRYLVAYFQRWRDLRTPARLYLLHAGMLTGNLAISALFFNLAIEAFGYSREFLGLLGSLSIGVAAVFSVPLWYAVTRIGLKPAMLISVVLQASAMFIFALVPQVLPLLLAVSLTGAAAVMFQVSSPPFMMRHSDAKSRDHLFSANTAINIGIAGLGALVAGQLPGLFAGLFGVDARSPLAYQASFAVAGCGLLLAVVPLLLIREANTATPAPPAPEQTLQTRRRQERLHALLATLRALRLADLQPRLLLLRVPEPYQSMIRRPWPVIRMLIPPFLISWGAALLIRYLNLFFVERYDLGDDLLGVIFAALNITTGVAALVAPIISMRLGKIRTVALTQIISIPFLLMLGFVPILGIAFGAALARGALFNMGVPLYDAFAMEQTEERARPIIIGLVNGAYTAGYLFAPLISTRVQALYGFTPLFIATTVFYTLAAVMNYVLFIRGR